MTAKKKTPVKKKPTVKRCPTEADEQKGFVTWFRHRFPGVIIFHINNSATSAVRGKKLKDLGVVSGIPDLFIPAFRCFVEMKRTVGGTVSSSQAEMMLYLKRVGYRCIVGYGATDASKKVLKALESGKFNTDGFV